MGRPHDSSRRRAALLLLAAVALVAIALIPRGVVRTTLAIADDPPSTAQSTGASSIPSVEHVDVDDVELPGVRALVAREEQDATILHGASAGVLTAAATAPTDHDGDPATLRDRSGPTPSSVPASPSGSRAPPVLS